MSHSYGITNLVQRIKNIPGHRKMQSVMAVSSSPGYVCRATIDNVVLLVEKEVELFSFHLFRISAINEFRSNPNYTRAHADALGVAFILEKYNSGVAILKQEPNGTFKILRAREVNPPNTTNIFEDISCN